MRQCEYRVRRTAPIFSQSDTMRAMAAKYLRLAKDTKDPIERSKFFDYAMIYAQLSEQAERRETSRATAGGDLERRDVPGRRRDTIARSRG
jgi:hypothetical protein